MYDEFMERVASKLKLGEPAAIWIYVYSQITPIPKLARTVGPYYQVMTESAGASNLIKPLMNEPIRTGDAAAYIAFYGTNPSRHVGTLYIAIAGTT